MHITLCHRKSFEIPSVLFAPLSPSSPLSMKFLMPASSWMVKWDWPKRRRTCPTTWVLPAFKKMVVSNLQQQQAQPSWICYSAYFHPSPKLHHAQHQAGLCPPECCQHASRLAEILAAFGRQGRVFVLTLELNEAGSGLCSFRPMLQLTTTVSALVHPGCDDG